MIFGWVVRVDGAAYAACLDLASDDCRDKEQASACSLFDFRFAALSPPLFAKVAPAVRGARAIEAADIGNLALVPLSDPEAALAIRTEDISESIGHVKLQLRSHRHAKRELDGNNAAAIMKWRGREGAVACAGAVRELPDLRDLLSVHAVPACRSMNWIRLILPADELVPRILALPHTEEVVRVLKDVKEKWIARHRQILHGSATPLPTEPKVYKKDKPSCLEAKICLCGSKGDDLWDLYLSVIRVIRRALQNAVFKLDMQSGDVVIHLEAMTVSHLEKYVAGTADTDSTSPEVLSDDGFAHVSMLYEKPLRPTLRCAMHSESLYHMN